MESYDRIGCTSSAGKSEIRFNVEWFLIWSGLQFALPTFLIYEFAQLEWLNQD